MALKTIDSESYLMLERINHVITAKEEIKINEYFLDLDGEDEHQDYEVQGKQSNKPRKTWIQTSNTKMLFTFWKHYIRTLTDRWNTLLIKNTHNYGQEL